MAGIAGERHDSNEEDEDDDARREEVDDDCAYNDRAVHGLRFLNILFTSSCIFELFHCHQPALHLLTMTYVFYQNM